MNKEGKILYWLLAIIGFLQMAGWLISSDTVVGLGFVTNASPLPLVFSHFRDTEPFSAKYEVAWTVDYQNWERLEVKPELYAKLDGPYNYRNVFGAVFAAGPVFQNDDKEKKIWETVLRRGLCDHGPLGKTFGLPKEVKKLRIYVHSRAEGKEGEWLGEISCG